MQEIKQLQVIVAEENPVTQRVLSNMLIYCGHSPSFFADTPESLLEGLSRDDADLALLSWGIASAQDFYLLKTLQGRDIFELVPLMVMVPGMDDGFIRTLGGYGLKHFIPVPMPVHLLSRRIEEAMFASPRARFFTRSSPLDDTADGGARHGTIWDDLFGTQKLAASMAYKAGLQQKEHAAVPETADNDTSVHDAAVQEACEPEIEALPETDRVPEADPVSDARTLFCTGRDALRQRRYAEAVDCFDQALALKPLFPEACKGLGLAYRGQGEQGKARHYCNKAAVSYVRTGRGDRAASLYRDLEKAGLNPMNPFKVLADWYKSRSDGTKALPLYEEAARLTPRDPMVAYNIFILQRRMKNAKAALAAVIRLLKACEDVADRKNLAWADSLYQKVTGRAWGAPAQAPEAPAPEAKATSQPTVLIVDDELHIRTLLERSLESLRDEGAEILFAEDGEKGLAMIREIRPDLVFLDVMMPKMNGFDVCDEVKNRSGMDDVYVIMLTAKGQEFDRRKGLESGADVYMTKPFRPTELLNMARAVLDM